MYYTQVCVLTLFMMIKGLFLVGWKPAPGMVCLSQCVIFVDTCTHEQTHVVTTHSCTNWTYQKPSSLLFYGCSAPVLTTNKYLPYQNNNNTLCITRHTPDASLHSGTSPTRSSNMRVPLYTFKTLVVV